MTQTTMPPGLSRAATAGATALFRDDDTVLRVSRNGAARFDLVKERGAAGADGLRQWLAQAAERPLDPTFAVEALAWCHAAVGETRPPAVAPELRQALIDRLLKIVARAQHVSVNEQPLVHQLLAGELAWTLAVGLAEVPSCRRLHTSARRALSAGLRELLDGEGLPHARNLALFRPLFGCWTRCRRLAAGGMRGARRTTKAKAVSARANVRRAASPGRETPGLCWTAAAETQYRWLVRAALRLTRPDGSHVFSDDSEGRWDRDLFRTALELGGDEDDQDIAALTLPRQKKRSRRISLLALPEPTLYSAWAATAIMQSQWSPEGSRLTVTWPGRSVFVELACGKEILWSGAWGCEIRVDDQVLASNDEWEEVCWFSDDEVDYLELEISLEGGYRIQRHILLSREDDILMLADAVLGRRPSRMEYRGWLPLRRGITLRGAHETREALLVGRRPRALVLPLALPEWRCDARAGELRQSSQGLELLQASHGRRMFAPLLLDLDPRRMARTPTWRQLTVAESLEIQPADVAVGYRVMVGDRQWLLYRSLGKKGNRTLLGHNLSTETLVARFDDEGEVEPILEIQ